MSDRHKDSERKKSRTYHHEDGEVVLLELHGELASVHVKGGPVRRTINRSDDRTGERTTTQESKGGGSVTHFEME